MNTCSTLQEAGCPERETALLKSENDEEIVESSKALSIGKDRIRLSSAARMRFKYLIKQGLLAEEDRIKFIEPIRSPPPTED
ncbi:hypothetical protein JTB14_004168 [Gonioctena quinquepunctata]|nr:hypothetical protein JTB14_004168 [Gonioctena quinquepunctata]